MNIGQLTAFWSRACLLFCCVLFTAPSQGAEQLNQATLDKWLLVTNEFIPMQDVFKRISDESDIAQKYTQSEFKAMSIGEQDKLMDQLLKDEGVYQQVYEVLHKKGWDSAGHYIRISTRIAEAIQVYMQDMMLKNLPAEQAQMVKEMMGGDVTAAPEDVALISKNWGKISQFIGKNIDSSKLPPMGQ